MKKYFIYYQPNEKDGKYIETSDCVIRALTIAVDKKWLEVFDDLVPLARDKQQMLNSNDVYREYLKLNGYTRYGISNKKGTKRPTVKEFTKNHKDGIYVLEVAHHLVSCREGKYYDCWNSGNKCLYGYWQKN